MPENKKETNVDSVKMLGEYKTTLLAELSENISRQKSRAAVIMASIKAKRDELLQKAEQIEKAKEEAKAAEKEKFEEVENKIKRESEKAVEKTVTAQDTPVVEPKTEVKAEKETKAEKEVKKDDTSAFEKETAKAEEKTEKKSKQDEKKQEDSKKPHVTVIPKTPFELAQENPEILPNGEVRRIYVPPTPKPKVTTRECSDKAVINNRADRRRNKTDKDKDRKDKIKVKTAVRDDCRHRKALPTPRSNFLLNLLRKRARAANKTQTTVRASSTISQR